MNETNPGWERLEDQLKWYSKESGKNKRWFLRLKVAEIIAAAIIPFTAGLAQFIILTGLLGVLVVVLEGIQGLYQFHDNWISYRSTSEALKHEKFLWLAKAGPYAAPESPATPEAVLAERVESLISREHAKWVSVKEQVGKGEPKGGN